MFWINILQGMQKHAYDDWAEAWVLILKWPVIIYLPFSKSVGLVGLFDESYNPWYSLVRP